MFVERDVDAFILLDSQMRVDHDLSDHRRHRHYRYHHGAHTALSKMRQSKILPLP